MRAMMTPGMQLQSAKMSYKWKLKPSHYCADMVDAERLHTFAIQYLVSSLSKGLVAATGPGNKLKMSWK